MSRVRSDLRGAVTIHTDLGPVYLLPGDRVPDGAAVDSSLLDDDEGEHGPDTTSEAAGGTTPPAAPPPVFGPDSDPAAHNVSEVAAYLDGITDPDLKASETKRILAAETGEGGKNRSTLVERYAS